MSDLENSITKLSLDNGGTTLIVTVKFDGNSNVAEFEFDIVYKFKSVTIGNNNETYYTIEDAIFAASNSTDKILIRANTIFSDKTVAEKVYLYDELNGYELMGKLIVSYYNTDNTYRKTFDTTSSNVSNAGARLTPQVTLVLNKDIKLSALSGSEIFINAERLRRGTNVNGLIDKDKYGVMILEADSLIILKSGSKFTNYGFSAGEGIIYSEAGSIVTEFMTLFDYKGGTITTDVEEYAVPLLYYAPLAISNKILFESGSVYKMYTFVTASNRRYFATMDILKVGLGENYMFDLKSGTLEKSVSNGKANFIFDNAVLDLKATIKITVAGVINFNAVDKDVALGSFYNIVIQNNSTINQEASILLIGGSTITIDSTSTINMNNNLYIDEIYEYKGIAQTTPLDNLGNGNVDKSNAFYDYSFIYNQIQPNNYYEYDETTKNSTNRSRLNIVGGATINVGEKGKIAGFVNEETFNLLNPKFSDESKTFTIDKIIPRGDKNGQNQHVRVNFGLIDNWDTPPSNDGEPEYKDTFSPYLYSEDENGELHFEHEPISLKMIKTVEGTSYGTLRLLQDQNGVYYIQIIEEGTSTTMLNGSQLFAVDYLDDGTVLDLFYDIAGNPHTIREKLRPVSFVNQNGVNYLDEILAKDGVIAAEDGSSDDITSYFIATFNRSNNNRYAKFMFSVQDSRATQAIINEMFLSFNANQNLWWLDQALSNNLIHQSYMQNIFDSLEVKVQVWNGYEWITQGSVELGSYLMESFLVELDLLGITGSEIQVRLLMPTNSGYMFDDVSIDFTENLPMIIHELDLVSAILNGETDVLDILSTINNQYVSLDHKDGVRLGFQAPELLAGYSRGFGVNMTGYIYWEQAQTNDPLEEEMIGKTFEEIKQIIINSGRQELIADIPKVEEFYYSILYVGSLEYEQLLEALFSFIA